MGDRTKLGIKKLKNRSYLRDDPPRTEAKNIWCESLQSHALSNMAFGNQTWQAGKSPHGGYELAESSN